MGIIDSLSAGYRLVGRRLYLMAIPVLLDLLLWLTPRLSVAPLLNAAADSYTELLREAAAQADTQAAALGNMVQMGQMTAAGLRELGAAFNLLTALVSSSILHVPSLVAAWALPPAGSRAVELTNAWAALGLWLLFALLGLLVGVIFLEMLAAALPLGESAKPAGVGDLLRATLRHLKRVLGFILLIGIVLAVLSLPYMLIMGVLVLLAPGLMLGVGALTLGILFVIFVYLYFVTAAIVLDDRAVGEAIVVSARIVRANLLRVIGFVLLVNVISIGIGILLNNLAAVQPAGTLAAIVINAFIGTGLAMALLVFYRARLIVTAQAGQPINLEP